MEHLPILNYRGESIAPNGEKSNLHERFCVYRMDKCRVRISSAIFKTLIMKLELCVCRIWNGFLEDPLFDRSKARIVFSQTIADEQDSFSALTRKHNRDASDRDYESMSNKRWNKVEIHTERETQSEHHDTGITRHGSNYARTFNELFKSWDGMYVDSEKRWNHAMVLLTLLQPLRLGTLSVICYEEPSIEHCCLNVQRRTYTSSPGLPLQSMFISVMEPIWP